ncbi:sulfatase [Granulicella mallensis]|uniref:Arylsulfatase A-like enzyme n=1 Tax=Granulicella mallensis TaxID=940614 RepID=A0A7W7ZUY7_9BACT|nr:sulfatase [Granulicella mallensis]MBB5066595.1 arylsulfatase A-like enzyme [Granulicella mallensis]
MPNQSQKRTTRRQFIAQAAGTAIAGVLTASASARETKKPNVLFFMSDDMRVELGCYGSHFRAQTPNLDALAQQGVRFDRNFCQFPLCNPSRASLLTGQVPLDTKVLGNRTNFRDTRPDLTSLPQLFREQGYVTARTGKIFHGGYDDPKAWTVGGSDVSIAAIEAASEQSDEDTQGKYHQHREIIPSQSVPPPPAGIPVSKTQDARAAHSDEILILDGDGGEHPENRVAETAIGYLRTYRDQPFFIGCGFSKPHSPPTAPQRFFDLYDPAKLELTPDFAAWPTVPSGFPKAAIRPRNADLFIGRGASTTEAKEVIRAYLASISWVDWNLGRVIHELDALGLRDNTIIVFVADHGYQLGEKGKWSKAGSLFEMGTRVPLIIHDPRAAGNGQTSTRLVQSLDIYPTLVELCGLSRPSSGLQGASLTPLLHRPQSTWKRPAFSLWSEDGKTIHGVAVRQDHWRYVEFGADGKNGSMLFNEQSDPLEMHNLAEDSGHTGIRDELSKLTAAYRDRTRLA